jgi:hypothetical protein
VLFLNAIALIGLGTLLIPILIHLQKRRTSRELSWGAMRFLRQSVQRRRRGLTLENLSLLLCRCLLVALFVIAMARPVIDSMSDLRWLMMSAGAVGTVACLSLAIVWPSRNGRMISGVIALLLLAGTVLTVRIGATVFESENANCDLAIVLDSSLTMNISDGGRSHFRTAIDEAQSLIDRLSGQSTASIVVAGPTSLIMDGSPFRNLNRARQQLDDLKPTAGGSDLRDAIERAKGLLAKGTNPRQQLIVFSDNQLTAWQAGSKVIVPNESGKQQVQIGLDTDHEGDGHSEHETDSTRPIRLFGRLAGLPNDKDNLAVTDVRVASPFVTINRPITFEIDVVNTGTRTVHGRTLNLSLDNTQAVSQIIPQLEPGTRTTIRLVQKMTATGAHVVSAHVSEPDLLPEDNRYDIVIPVVDQIPVLILDGNASPSTAQHSATFASLALDPRSIHEPSDEMSADQRPIHVKRHLLADLPSELEAERLSEYSVILLSDAQNLSPTLTVRLADYVNQGGSLWIIPNEMADADFYNSWITNQGGHPLVPGIFQDTVTNSPKLDATNQQILSIDIQSIKQPVMKSIIDRGEHDFGQLSVRNTRHLKPRNNSTVPVRLTNGEPLFIEHSIGRGRVLVQSISLARPDSNLMSLVSYPVLMHLWTEQLALNNLAPLSFKASPNLIVELPNVQSTGTSAQLTTPDGEQRPVTVSMDGSRALVQAGLVSLPGVYQLRFDGSNETPIPCTVTREANESDLTIASPEQLKELSGELKITWLETADKLTRVGTGESTRKELWKWMLYATIWLLALEPLIARWIVRRRSINRIEILPVATSDSPSEDLLVEFKNSLRSHRTAKAVSQEVNW